MKSDIYRDKIVNTFIKRKAAQEAFIAKKGIIAPIRAYDISAEFETEDHTSEDHTKLFNEYAKAIKLFDIDDEIEKVKVLKHYCNPIGYFAACPEDTYVKFGISICSPRDGFNKDIGILTALNKNYALPGIGQIPADKVEAFPEDEWFAKFKNPSKIIYEDIFGYGEMNVRYWPISFEDQYKLFKKRCSVYYKNIVK